MPPGTLADGRGGASSRMKPANLSISLKASGPLLSGLDVSLGAVLNWQF